jgi:hypothetical protein
MYRSASHAQAAKALAFAAEEAARAEELRAAPEPEAPTQPAVVRWEDDGDGPVFILPDGERLQPSSRSEGKRAYALKRFERFGADAEFWAMAPTADEIVEFLNHVLELTP